MKQIPLGKSGQFALVDDEDFERVSCFKWYTDTLGYIQRTYSTVEQSIKGKKTCLLHREILPSCAKEIDHINGNKADNRKENLRECTRSQNCINQAIRKDNKSGVKGVYWAKDRQKWRACIGVNWKTINLGTFKNKEDALVAYNDAAIKYFGEFAVLNKCG